MINITQGLDHVGVVANDLDLAVRAYEAMGFALTPISHHSASRTPGGAPSPMGSANRCAMFRWGYLELVAIVDPTLDAGPFPAFLARYAGIHLVAFRTDDAESAAAELERRGVALDGVFALQRNVDTEDGESTLRISLVRPAVEAIPEARLSLVQHHTPENLWQPRYLDHPNGVTALSGTVLCVDDPPSSAARFEKLLGVAATRQDEALVLSCRHGRVSIVSPDSVDDLLPGAQRLARPYVAGASFVCADLERAADVLADGDVPFARGDGRISVPASAGCGAVIVFEQAEAAD